MTTRKRLLAAVLASVTALGLAGCDDELPTASGGAMGAAPGVTTTAPSVADDMKPMETEPAGAIDMNAETGSITWLGYYDLHDDGSSSKQAQIFESDQYNGNIEYVYSASGAAYFEKLSTMILSDDSPDIVRYEWLSFPHGMYKNMYTALDEYIDLDSELWSGIKSVAEDFSYNGKHFYYPYKTTSNFALNYNKTAIQEAGLDDPYDLYMDNNWTWDSFKQLLVDWCNMDDAHVGYAGVTAMSFIATTGMKSIDVQSDGTIINNLNEPNIQRTQEFLESLYKEGLTYQAEFGDWLSPQSWAQNSRNVLFDGVGPEWCLSAASQEMKGTDNEFAFVPFPRDPQADKYYIAYDTFGYLIPTGAKNIKGALDWINLCRIYETDEERIATEKADLLSDDILYVTKCTCGHKYDPETEKTLDTCPDCGKARNVKFKLVWTEEQYDLFQDMKNPEKFGLVFDDCYGFTDSLTKLFDETLFNGPIFTGASWTQLRTEYYGTVEDILNGYRS